MAKLLPDVPYAQPVTDNRGLISIQWSNFVRALYVRVGEATALSNVELAAQSDTTALQVSFTTLQAQVTALAATVSGADTLNQGRAL